MWDIWKRCPENIHKYSLEFKNEVEETEAQVRKPLASWRLLKLGE